MKGHEIRLARRPHGAPVEDDFTLAEAEVAELADGQVVIRTTLMSVDPYMRGRMNEGPSYVPPFELGGPLDGAAVGEVVASRSSMLAEGDVVRHALGWREFAVAGADAVQRVDLGIAPPEAYLSTLGSTGLTAYVGLLDIAGLRSDDVVFVSAAAGAVGSMVGQIAKARGHRVIGSAGSAAKVAHLRNDLGLDSAFDYHDGPVVGSLRAAAPEGVDVYFDNVGGDHLEAALDVLRPHGRVAMCGAISQYNATEPSEAPRNLALAVGKRLTLRGFIVGDHVDRRAAFLDEVGALVRAGRIAQRETIVDGLANAPRAFIDLLRGVNTGKMLVRVG